jgi:hypothetical protein
MIRAREGRRSAPAWLWAAALFALAACGLGPQGTAAPASATPAARTVVAFGLTAQGAATATAAAQHAPAPGSCHMRGALPDATCTPGAYNPAVTQETIRQTICVRGWTATVRPAVAYTGQLKREQIAQYGFIGRREQDFEEDHFVPLDIGGNPSDPHNLWPQPRLEHPGADEKDELEAALGKAVCDGTVTLDQARRAVQDDWLAAYHRFVKPE